MKKIATIFLTFSLLLVTFAFTNINQASAAFPTCDLYSISNNHFESDTAIQEPIPEKAIEGTELTVVEDGDVSIQSCGGIKRMTTSDISRTGSTAHRIKSEYGYDSKFDLYKVTKTGQVVIVRITTKVIVEFTHYFVK